MYIDPFVAGVFCTLFIEMTLYIFRDMARKSRVAKHACTPTTKRQNI